jgi:hypothetical protein
MTDNNGYVLSPLPVAPVHETDMVLLPDGLKALKRVAKMVGLDRRGAYLNLDAGECTGNEFRPKAARDEGLWVQGILRPW